MDAQNAAGSDKAKPPASPTRPAAQPGDEADKPSLKAPSKETGSDGDGKSPASSGDKTKPASKSSRDADDEAAADRDSDAETIVLPGKDGHSPSKARKVKHEDNSDVEDLSSHRKRRDTEPSKSSDRDRNSLASEGVSKKKASRADRDSLRPDKPSKNQDGSSGLSSAPTSPPNNRRRPVATHDSDSDGDRKRSPKLSNKDRAKSTDQMMSHKRKASRAASDDEHAEERKAQRRRRLEDRPDWLAAKEKSSSKDAKAANRDQRSASSKWVHDNHNGRSASPPLRAHRRSISTQLPSNPANGLSHKKKRLPAPLRSTDYHSDESSASGSPHPRNSKVRNLSTPATAESNTSPAKMPSSKRHVDAHGQTPLARACTKGEFEVAKQRLMERPDDIDFADYAGNTPLQSAAINGFDNIVKLLIDAGCNVDCVNDQKDTPLLDAVENGHLDVVKLLLAAGVNPRKANLQGEEPLDRISDDLDNAEEIREALMEAKKSRTGNRKTSEDLHGDHADASSHGADDSPRQSPAPAAQGRRPGNTRAQTTSNHHLYVNLDDKTLRLAAAKGDEETVTRVLQVKDRCDNPEAMVGAARGGHEVVLQLLLALGSADPDPAPVPSLQPEFATPMLAAIGQENINVVKLLLDQGKFDPTRRYKGLTYYEIAEMRQGTNWKEEEQILKDAYDAYEQKSQRDTKNKSPRRERARAQERDVGQPTSRSTVKEEPRAPRRNLLSPSREAEGKKKSIPRAVTSPKEKRRSQSFSQHDDQKSLKRGPGRPKKDDTSAPATASDREASPTSIQKLVPKSKRTESDLAALSSEGETVKPRRKLVSKGELRGEREKQRRASMASNTSSHREPPSPREPDSSDKAKEPLSEKYHDRTKALKRDESRERPAGDNTGKRHRSSVTPPHPGNGEKDGDAPVKRRRLDSDGKERRIRASDSHDERKSSRDSSIKAKSTGDSDDRKSGSHADANSKSSIQVKSEQVDIEMPDAPSAEEEAQKREAETEAARKKAEQERQQREADEKKREEEAKQKEAEKLKHEEEEKTRKAEEERKRAEEEARLKREAEDAKRREAERQAREKEEERKRKEEEERRQREEEELLRKQQLEREAAEQARRQREEEERKERENRERLKREEAERKRAAHEAEVRRLREEERQQRLAKLPPLLRWLAGCQNPQTREIARKFSRIVGVRYDTIRPEALGTPEGREQWVLNTHVALLLGIKELELARFTSWDRLPVSDLAKQVLWMLERDQYSLVGPDMIELGTQVPGLYTEDEPLPRLDIQTMNRLRKETMPLFKKLDMFFVKLSDLLYIIPSFPHLRGLELLVTYKELPQDTTNLLKSPRHFKNDPDNARYLGFGPGWKKFVNGEFVAEKLPRICPTSKTPFPEKRVPRRGLQQVYPDDPDYARICKEQGLDHLLCQSKYQKSPSLPNGVHPSPPMSHEEAAPDMAEPTSPAPADGAL